MANYVAELQDFNLILKNAEDLLDLKPKLAYEPIPILAKFERKGFILENTVAGCNYGFFNLSYHKNWENVGRAFYWVVTTPLAFFCLSLADPLFLTSLHNGEKGRLKTHQSWTRDHFTNNEDA